MNPADSRRIGLFLQQHRPPSIALLFSRDIGATASPLDPLRRAECSASPSAPRQRGCFLQGATAPRRPGRTPLRATNEINASQDEVRHDIQFHIIRG